MQMFKCPVINVMQNRLNYIREPVVSIKIACWGSIREYLIFTV